MGAPRSPTARGRGRCRTASTRSSAPSAMGRRVARAAAPSRAAARRRAHAGPWRFRGADLDLAGHVNNAVYWAALEDELVADEPAAGLVAEIEHRAPRPPARRPSARTARCAGSPTGGHRRRDADVAPLAEAAQPAGSPNASCASGAPQSSIEAGIAIAVAGAELRDRAVERPLRERVGEALLGAVAVDRARRTARRAGSGRRACAFTASGTSAKSITWPSSCSTTVARSVARSPSSHATSRSTVKPRGAAARDAERRAAVGERPDRDQPVDLGDQPRRLRPRPRDRGEDPGAVGGRHARQRSAAPPARAASVISTVSPSSTSSAGRR